SCFFSSCLRLPISTLFPYTTLFRSRLETLLTRYTDGHPEVRKLRAQIADKEAHEARTAPPPPPPSEPTAAAPAAVGSLGGGGGRSEEHTSELQSRRDLVCRLLLEKK